MFKDKNIIILADLPNPEEKTCIIMTKIKFEKLFSFDPQKITQEQTIELMNWARKHHKDEFGEADIKLLKTDYKKSI